MAAVAQLGGRNFRALLRLNSAFVLDVAGIVRGDMHVLDTLLLTTIVQANVALITQSADLQLAYAEAETPPPDALRRPISINALAQSLNLPFETVRRRVHGLIAQQLCVQTDAGVVVPTAVVTGPEYVRYASQSYERLRAFYLQLRELGVLGSLPAPTARLSGESVPLRAVGRLLGDYIGRVMEPVLRLRADPVDSLILMEAYRSNVEYLGAALDDGPDEGAYAIPDEARRPVPLSTVARRLGIPAETTRRRAAALIADGVLRRVDRGVIMPTDAVARPEMTGHLVKNVLDLQRLFVSLSLLGVTALWDELEPAS